MNKRKSLGYQMRYVCMMLACLLMVGCQEEELVPSYGEGVGTLVISGLEVETAVGDIQTRASVEDEDIPDASEFTIMIFGSDDYQNSVSAGTIDLPAGSYTITASCGKNEMSEQPYFLDTKEITIEAGKTRTVTLYPSLQTAILRPHLDETLVNQYESCKLEIANGSGKTAELTNDKDFYLPVEDSYTLTLAGTNKLGNPASHSWKYSAEQFVKATRYIVNCNPDIPSFTLPAQAETNAWSKFIYVTPMTAKNFSKIPDGMTADEILADVVYEASADGQTWIPAITDGEKIVIKDLQASTSYIVRARYGGVNSGNTETLVTESAQELVNGDMETWDESVYYSTYGRQIIYHYYVGASSSDKYWGTRNTLTMDGVEDATSTGTRNQRTAYRWNSCTIPTSDAISGQAAEIRTMAFANFAIDRGTGIFASRESMASDVLNNANVFVGWLYTGEDDVTMLAEPDKSGIEQTARPLSISFSYKYEPYNGDNFVVSAILYDENQNQIAYVNDFTSSQQQSSYNTITLDFIYKDLNTKVAAIYIMFKSGEKSTVNDVRHIEGSYDANPWSLDTFVGSVLKIDNVVLNYDYE